MLYEKKGEVSDYIDAVIEDGGRLQVIRNSFGPGDYETEVTAAVSAQEKEKLLLALMQKVFGGNMNAIDDFIQFAESKGIKVDAFRWP